MVARRRRAGTLKREEEALSAEDREVKKASLEPVAVWLLLVVVEDEVEEDWRSRDKRSMTLGLVLRSVAGGRAVGRCAI